MRALGGVMRSLLVVLLAAVASGCATPAGTGPGTQDPWENFNRKVFGFNETVDKAVLKPVASAYVRVVPEPGRKGVSNVLGNIGDVWSAANQFLQGKVEEGLKMGARVFVNTTVGLVGLMDPATDMGLPRRSEDFGQTLGRWGMGAGPYLVLPLMGPSTARDGPASLVDRLAGPSALGGSDSAVYAIAAVEAVDMRANLLSASELLDDMALDKYSVLRQVYLARRLDAVHDGAPPFAPFDDSAAQPPATQPPSAP